MMFNMGEKRGICFMIWMFINYFLRDVNLVLWLVMIWVCIFYY